MKHKHSFWIKLWADGEEIEWRNSHNFPWSRMLDSGNWDHFPEYTQFRVRPKQESFTLKVRLEHDLDIYASTESPNLLLTFENKKLVSAEVLPD